MRYIFAHFSERGELLIIRSGLGKKERADYGVDPYLYNLNNLTKGLFPAVRTNSTY
jgi:hypothetical protein